MAITEMSRKFKTKIRNHKGDIHNRWRYAECVEGKNKYVVKRHQKCILGKRETTYMLQIDAIGTWYIKRSPPSTLISTVSHRTVLLISFCRLTTTPNVAISTITNVQHAVYINQCSQPSDGRGRHAVQDLVRTDGTAPQPSVLSEHKNDDWTAGVCRGWYFYRPRPTSTVPGRCRAATGYSQM